MVGRSPACGDATSNWPTWGGYQPPPSTTRPAFAAETNLAADDVEEFGDLAAARMRPPDASWSATARRRRHFTLCGRTATDSRATARPGAGRSVADALAARKTTRGFDPSRPLTLEQLSEVPLVRGVRLPRLHASIPRSRSLRRAFLRGAPCTPSRPTRWCVTSKAWPRSLPLFRARACARADRRAHRKRRHATS